MKFVIRCTNMHVYVEMHGCMCTRTRILCRWNIHIFQFLCTCGGGNSCAHACATFDDVLPERLEQWPALGRSCLSARLPGRISAGVEKMLAWSDQSIIVQNRLQVRRSRVHVVPQFVGHLEHLRASSNVFLVSMLADALALHQKKCLGESGNH